MLSETEVLECLPLADCLGAKLRIPAEDARQEAAVALVRSESKFNPERGEFAAFAHRVIHNHLLKVAVVYSSKHSQMCWREDSYVEDKVRGEEYVALRKALKSLTPEVRQALEMRYGETEAGFSEIGEALGCGHQAASAMVAAGLARLRRMIE